MYKLICDFTRSVIGACALQVRHKSMSCLPHGHFHFNDKMLPLLLVLFWINSVSASCSSPTVPHVAYFHCGTVYEENPAEHACHLELGIETFAGMGIDDSLLIYASKLRILSENIHTRVVKKILEQEVQSEDGNAPQLLCMSKLIDQVEGDEHINTILDSKKVGMRYKLLKKLGSTGLLIRGVRDGNDVLVSEQLEVVNQNDVDIALKEAVEAFKSAQEVRENVIMARMILSLVAEKASEKAVASTKPKVTEYIWNIIQKARAKTQTSE